MSKALWYIAKHGCKPAVKVRKSIRSKSILKAKKDSQYNRVVSLWKIGRECAGCGLRDMKTGLPICGVTARRVHFCTQNHHMRGRLGPLLMDQRFWIPVCSEAHRWLDANREQARKYGLLCRVGEFNTVPKETKHCL